MKQLDLNANIKDLDGKEIEPACKYLAGMLMHEKEGDPVKYFDWAFSLNKCEVITVDDSDFTKIKAIVKNTQAYPMLVKGQLLKTLEEIK